MAARGSDDYLGLVLAGWVMAFALPVGGVVTAVLLQHRRPDHALRMLLVSVLSGVVAVVLGVSAVV
jgi:hypothetical protein